ncbi:hypothetical protein BP00DRAFT_442573 [Aspergillus indologenus CBS 114.80]|uniref:Uncharacterized protein n=1 Tax=Aspergillus indologenus CBS 114.80 TaxID=1450541 RepID=A0A2V5JB05_9EURO|nr:hypothetical protein BP00DRAFT_442573 [Aspergillus indologenus CBS 114.80]
MPCIEKRTICQDTLLEALCFDLQLEEPYRILYKFLLFFNVADNKQMRNTSASYMYYLSAPAASDEGTEKILRAGGTTESASGADPVNGCTRSREPEEQTHDRKLYKSTTSRDNERIDKMVHGRRSDSRGSWKVWWPREALRMNPRLSPTLTEGHRHLMTARYFERHLTSPGKELRAASNSVAAVRNSLRGVENTRSTRSTRFIYRQI